MSKLSRICLVTNNVGNIRFSGANAWLGQCGEYKGFVKFIDQIYSIRALIKLLRNYINLHDDTTVSRIISRYAPSNENNTKSYIDYVEHCIFDVGGNPDCIASGSYSFFILCRSICFYETNFELTSTEYNYVITRFNL